MKTQLYAAAAAQYFSMARSVCDRLHAWYVPLCTRHGAEPFGSSELTRWSKVFAVFTLQHWRGERKKLLDHQRNVQQNPSSVFLLQYKKTIR